MESKSAFCETSEKLLEQQIYHFLSHDGKEVSEGNFPSSIFVHFTYHLFDLLLLRFKAQGSHCDLGQCETGQGRGGEAHLGN